jgi:hypothetical protein
MRKEKKPKVTKGNLSSGATGVLALLFPGRQQPISHTNSYQAIYACNFICFLCL